MWRMNKIVYVLLKSFDFLAETLILIELLIVRIFLFLTWKNEFVNETVDQAFSQPIDKTIV